MTEFWKLIPASLLTSGESSKVTLFGADSSVPSGFLVLEMTPASTGGPPLVIPVHMTWVVQG